MKRLIAIALCAACMAGLAAQNGGTEIVFALDSTGSMGGLIEGAKRKIWSIANSALEASGKGGLKIGFISYRDRGDAYVTKRFDLTGDIDAVFENLQSFQADGGGDGPESVNQALHEALGRFSWGKDKQSLRIIFLVGDYPPHMDYPQDVAYQKSCDLARERGIIINTVQCGDYAETQAVWREIARLAKGEYLALEQSGNMVEVSTPYDEKIAKLSAQLGTTVLAYGSKSEQEASKGKIAKAAEALPSVTADRARYNLSSGGKAIQGRGDLLEDSKEGLVDILSLKDSQLPPELAKLKPSERKAYLDKLALQREELNAELASLSLERARFLEKEARRAPPESQDSFDSAVSTMIEKQAADVKGH